MSAVVIIVGPARSARSPLLPWLRTWSRVRGNRQWPRRRGAAPGPK